MFSLSTRVLLFVGLPALLFGCEGPGRADQDLVRDPSTAAMADTLEAVHARVDPTANRYANSERVAYFEELPVPNHPVKATLHKYRLGQEHLRAGDTREAIQRFQDVYRRMQKHPQRYRPNQHNAIREALGVAWLRLGEQENCLANHTSKSCILPIQGEGLHDRPEGSRNAIKYFAKFLDAQPENRNAQWLLNIAYMTLGEYPEGVPSKWLVPLDRAESEEIDIESFSDIAPQLGLDEIDLSGGVVVEDFTGNGYLDIVTSSWHLEDQIRFYVNNGDGTFTERTEKAGLRGITGGLNLRHADYNNDGHVDVLVLRGAWRQAEGTYPNSLLRNNGDSTFTDVTVEAGLDRRLPTQTAAWGDYNNDGNVDLFVGNEHKGSQVAPSALYRNDGDGTFTEVSGEVGLGIREYVKGVTWGDYNNDGHADLYVSVLDGHNLLFRNEGKDEGGTWAFTDVTSEAGVAEPKTSFPTWFWDYNNDGHLDLFVSGYQVDLGDVAREYLGETLQNTTFPRLYRNNGDGTFTDVAKEAGLHKVLYTMGSNYGDLNNDGLLDFYVGTGDPDFRSLMPSRMFLNNGGDTFSEVTLSGHFGNIQKGHAVAFADFNNNGRQDIYMDMGGALEGDTYQNLFFRNPGFENNWMTIRVVGTESNRLGIGARIEVIVESEGKSREVHRVVRAGSSFGGNPYRTHIGLGASQAVKRLTVTWPASGQVQTFTDVPVNEGIRIREGKDRISKLDEDTFPYQVDGLQQQEMQDSQDIPVSER